LFLMAIVSVAMADDETTSPEASPETWPVSFQEIYTLIPREGMQLRLGPDGLDVRRFHLRIDSEVEIEVSVTRDFDSQRLFSERRAREVSAVIPWGRGETGVLSIASAVRPDGQSDRSSLANVVVALAADPAPGPVHSFSVNRFLEELERGEPGEAVVWLDRALAQDATDTVAARLVAKVYGYEGTPAEVVEQSRVDALRERMEVLEENGDNEAIVGILSDDHGLTTDRGRSAWDLLAGRVRLERDEPMLAIQDLYRALDRAPDATARFAVYPLLVEANLAVGNDAQADAVIQRALAEAPDDTTKAWIEGWKRGSD